jgi:hypothetical protein
MEPMGVKYLLGVPLFLSREGSSLNAQTLDLAGKAGQGLTL